MQQGFKMPQKKKDPMREQVKSDLEAAGVQISRDLNIYETNKPIVENPENDPAVRIETAKDMITILEADLEHISKARELPGIQINERNPEYKQAMDEYVKGINNALGTLKSVRLELISEYKKA
jgi:hypothetical protein